MAGKVVSHRSTSVRHRTASPNGEPHHGSAATDLSPQQLKHLDYITDTVGRHVTHAFAVKGWSLTVTGLVFAYAAAHLNPWIAAVALVPPIAFAWLDLYYLRQARLYEEMYRGVIHADPAVYPLDMDATRYHDPHAHPRCSYGQIMKMGSWWVLHLMVVAVGLVLLAAALLK